MASYQVQNCPAGLNIRDAPSAAGNLMGTMPNGTVVTSKETQGDWCHHEKGWSLMRSGDKIFMTPAGEGGPAAPGGPSASVSSHAPPAGAFSYGAPPAAVAPASSPSGGGGGGGGVYLVQNCPVGLNVRDSPSAAGNKVGAPLANGSQVVAIQVQGDWMQHQTGWSLMRSGASVFLLPVGGGGGGGMASPPPAYTPSVSAAAPSVGGGEAYTVVNVPQGLNVRDGPYPTANKIGAPLAQGSVVVVSEKQGAWFRHASGWSLSSDGSTIFMVPGTQAPGGMGMGGGGGGMGFGFGGGGGAGVVQAPPTPVSAGGETFQVINCANGLNVRMGPSTQMSMAGAPLANGSIVVVTERQGAWVRHATGWSMAGDGPKSFLMPVASGGAQSAPVAQQPPMATQSFYGAPQAQQSFYQQPAMMAPTVSVGGQYMVQNCPNGLNLRNSPSTMGAKIGVLQNGAVVTCQQVQGDWMFNGLGWCMMRDGFKYLLVPVAQGGMMMQQPMQMQPMQMQPMQMQPMQVQPMVGGMGVAEQKAGQPHQVQNCPTGLNVRMYPQAGAQLMGSALPNGSLVYVTNRQGVWFQHERGWSLSQDSGRVFLAPVVVPGAGGGMGMGVAAPAAVAAPQLSIPEGAKQELYTVVNASKGLNVRNGPGTEFQLTGAPLANGSQIVVVQTKGNWAQHLSGWSLMRDDHGNIFMQGMSGGASGGAAAGGSGGEGHMEGVVQCEFCNAPFKSEEDVFCSKCGKGKTNKAAGGQQESPPAFNPNY